MDRKQLKEAGKSLFKKNYWYSVVVAFLMAFTGTASTGFNFNFSTDTSSSSENSLDAILGSGESADNFFDEFFGGGNIDAFLDEFMQEPISSVIILILLVAIAVGIVLGYFIFNSFRCGGIRYFLKSRKNQPAEIKEVFENLKDKTNVNIAKVTFSRDIQIFLWMLLFIVPGMIKSFEYWAVDYILAVRPNIDKGEAQRLSKILMNGNKADLFVLELSFLGWGFLSSLTGGLLNIFYVGPYIQATMVEYFSQIRLEALAKGTITPNDIPDYEFIDPQVQYQQQFHQQPKNVVYRSDGMPISNTISAQQPFQHNYSPPTQKPKNIVFRPDGVPMSNMAYYEQPVESPIDQPTKSADEFHSVDTTVKPLTEDPNE